MAFTAQQVIEDKGGKKKKHERPPRVAEEGGGVGFGKLIAVIFFFLYIFSPAGLLAGNTTRLELKRGMCVGVCKLHVRFVCTIHFVFAQCVHLPDHLRIVVVRYARFPPGMSPCYRV